jgi:2-amino-4-hydroxy-6-hydroxymethyldihydropteridine diphosphokinase
MQISTTVLALGANIPGRWGDPQASIDRAVAAIAGLKHHVTARSPTRATAPLGPIRQPQYHNCTVLLRCRTTAPLLLRTLKRLERAAGRRQGARMGPRPLDIDIVCHGGRLAGAALRRWPVTPAMRRQAAGRLVLPHPELHRRRFVLEPLAEIAPRWRHPATGRTAREMLLDMLTPRPARPGGRRRQ